MPENNISQINMNGPATSISENDIINAGQVKNLLLLAWKNCSLYPEGHNAAVKALENLKTSFESFFSRHNSLRFIIGKDKLLWNNKVIHEVPTENPSEDLVSILYRDGVQWLEFNYGLSLDELIYFFSALNKYRSLSDEADGDIVTCLNGGNLEHIDFKAIDIFWENLPLIDFSTLNDEVLETVEPEQQDYGDEAEDLESSEEKHAQVKSIADPSVSSTLWAISPVEQRELQKMVQEEENWDNREDVLEVLLIILRSQTEQYNFSSVLDFAMAEIIDTIKQEKFELLLNFFQSLYQLLYSDASTELNWRRPIIEGFFKDLSKAEVFDQITIKLVTLHDADIEIIENLREILLYFSPSIVALLAPVILKTKSSATQKMLMEVIEYLCLRDMEPLATLLDHPDHKLAEKLLPMLGRLRGEKSYNIFLKMSEHSSDIVRREAVKLLLNRDSQSVLKLFHLIEDPSLEIRELILAEAAKQRSTLLENLLFKHIKKNIDNKNTDYLLACYSSLGQCGSEKTIPFLRQVLLNNGWNRFWGLGRPVHREGAATALALLDKKQAENTLMKASKSRFKVIRNAFQKAMAARETSGEDNNV